MLAQINGHAEATRVLDEGRRRLCQETGLESPKRRDVIWFLFQDAMQTSRRLPDKEQGWLLSGNRAAWPDIVHTLQERFEVERERITDGIATGALLRAPMRHLDPGAENRMLEVLGWCRYLRARNVNSLVQNRRLFLSLASGIEPRHLRWAVKLRGDSRNMVNSIRIRCLGQIEAGLEAEKLV